MDFMADEVLSLVHVEALSVGTKPRAGHLGNSHGTMAGQGADAMTVTLTLTTLVKIVACLEGIDLPQRLLVPLLKELDKHGLRIVELVDPDAPSKCEQLDIQERRRVLEYPIAPEPPSEDPNDPVQF